MTAQRTTAVDITGLKFGKLTSLRSERSSKFGARIWICACDCGNETEASVSELKRGHKRSCGCLFSERVQNKQLKHGGCSDPEYWIWVGMRHRCYRPRNIAYPSYGGRGIAVCDRWLESYANFLADMGRRPTPKHTLDRINNNGNYEPSNCRWATSYEQCRNKRNTALIEFDGRRMIMKDWANELGINKETLRRRVRCHGVDVAMRMPAPGMERRRS